MTTSTRVRILVALVAAVTAACSLLVDTAKDQCTTNADCAAQAACVEGVCQLASVADGAAGSADGASLEDGAAGDAGCKPKAPSSQTDFLNEKCTNATCIDFDNCARLGVCDGGLPPLVDPPVGGI